MDTERTERVADIVEQVLESSPETRSKLLASLRREDPDVCREAEALLRFEEEATDFIEAPAYIACADFLASEDGELKVGELLNEYKMLSFLGEGGMGEVYLAEDMERGRKVALKMVRGVPGRSNLIRHFRQEERILAQLNHPNIAQLYSTALTPSQVPYLVMEYVEGEPLDTYCERKQLSIRDRLDLFRKVCAAVAYAHRHLVIHRDLKPANIRVTPEGEPKLLDFGIAKLLDDSAPPAQLAGQTMTLAAAMTPDYASPEQIRGEPMTTASDVYSLGIVLYQLLTNQKPYRIKGRRLDEISRVILEQEATRPSTALRRAARTRMETRKAELLQGDLDNIVLMALRKEPGRRYSSAAELGEDIRRYLIGWPVIAHKDTLTYRTSKFVTRHRLGVAVAAAVALAVISSLVVAVWEANRATRERDLAQKEKVKAQEINKFLQSILSAASPEAKGKNATVADVLSDATERVEKEFANQPELKAQALVTIGRTYTDLGDDVRAKDILTEALTLNTQLYGEESGPTAINLIYLSVDLLNVGRANEAEQFLTQAIETMRKLKLPENHDYFYGMFVLGELYVRKGDYAKAKPLLEQALSLAEKQRDPNNEDAAYVLISMGRLKQFSGDDASAEVDYRRSIEILRRLAPRFEPRLAIALMNLGSVLTNQGRYDDAINALNESDLFAEKIGESIYVLVVRQSLGTAYLKKGDYAKAIEEGQRAIAIGRRIKLEGLASFSEALNCVGRALTATGRAGEAEAYLQEAVAIRRRSATAALLSSSEIALGECLIAQAKYADAEPLLVDGYSKLTAASGQNNKQTIEARQQLVRLYELWNKPELATQYR